MHGHVGATIGACAGRLFLLKKATISNTLHHFMNFRFLLVSPFLWVIGCGPQTTPAQTLPEVRFTNVTATSGIQFVHENGAQGKKWLPETMGSGVASIDYDLDGSPDLFFVNQRRWPGGASGDASGVAASRPGSTTSQLYRNLGNLQFEDVSEKTGLALQVFGMGAVAGDLNADGAPDLVVTALGDTLCLRNEKGVFRECSKSSGIVTPHWTDRQGKDHPMWGTSAALLDFNNDGVLDLFVAAYVKWSPETDIYATLDGKTKAFTTPDLYPGDSSRLYQGTGKGQFRDVTESSGVFNPNGKSLGVAVCDLESDGWQDIVVANDTQPNFLYWNQKGHYQDIGAASGIAYDANGRARAGMGVDTARWNASTGRLAIAIGNFSREPMSFFEQMSARAFQDMAADVALARPTHVPLTFGLLFQDFDLDGRLDLVLANGHIEPTVQKVYPEVSFAQKPQVFWQAANHTFQEWRFAGGHELPGLVGRGLLACDFDGDGDSDLVLTQNGGPAVLLRCDRSGAAARNRALRIQLTSPDGNPAAIGAVVRATVGGVVEERTVHSGSSYLSHGEPTLSIGCGTADLIEKLEVRWPSGATSVLTQVPVNNTVLRIKP